MSVSLQPAEMCKQGWMNDASQPFIGRMGSVVDTRRRRKDNGGTTEAALLDSAEGGGGMSYTFTKPRPWRGGALAITYVYEVAQN